MYVKFWGVRGSVATAIVQNEVRRKLEKAFAYAGPADLLSPEKVDEFIDSLPLSIKGTFGGNTTCVEIRNKNDDIFIIDGGTGLARFGQQLMLDEKIKKGTTLRMFVTHTHWDHIQGMMFFGPFFIPENNIHFYSCFQDIKDRLRYQTPPTHFPITFEDLPIQKEFHYMPEGVDMQVDGFTIGSKAVKHPGTAYSYKFTDENKKTFIFCSDAEFNLEVMQDIVPYIEYFKDADVLVFDTQYTFSESFQKIDWGHSSAQMATDIAIKSNVKKLILFHHDPSYNDEKMDSMTIQSLKYKELMAPSHFLEIETAYEGLELNI
jgi:phosphoribosyl 1,2-cyclic phosphodiesterase